MTPLSDAERAVLELEGAAIGPVASMGWPVENVGAGLSVADAPTTIEALAAVDFVNCRFVRPSLPEIHARGANVRLLQDRPGIVQFSGPSTREVFVRSVQRSDGAVQRDKDHQGTVFLDLARLGTTVVSQDDVVVLFRPQLDTLSIALVSTHTPSLPRAPIDEWLQSERDPWLQQTALDRARSRQHWDVAVAVGLVGRLLEVESTGRARELVTAMRRGDTPTALVGPRDWARQLDAPARDALTTSARRMIDALRRQLKSRTVRDALEFCRRRDDVESARHVLRDALGRDVLAEDIAILDRAAAEWRAGIELDAGDEGLRRAALADPDAWWGEM